MKRIDVDFVSPPECEYLAAELLADGQILCRVRVERDDYVPEVDFFAVLRDPIEPVSLVLSDFIETLDSVVSELVAVRRKAEEGSREG